MVAIQLHRHTVQCLPCVVPAAAAFIYEMAMCAAAPWQHGGEGRRRGPHLEDAAALVQAGPEGAAVLRAACAGRRPRLINRSPVNRATAALLQAGCTYHPPLIHPSPVPAPCSPPPVNHVLQHDAPSTRLDPNTRTAQHSPPPAPLRTDFYHLLHTHTHTTHTHTTHTHTHTPRGRGGASSPTSHSQLTPSSQPPQPPPRPQRAPEVLSASR